MGGYLNICGGGRGVSWVGYDQSSVYLESTEALITIKDPEPNFLKRDKLH